MGGLIFTYVWAFDQKDDWDYIDNLTTIFQEQGGTSYFVELEANIDERLKRNKTEHRLAHKPTKRDIESSDNQLKKGFAEHRLNSEEGEIKYENYIRIDNTNLDAKIVASKIKEAFNL